MQPRKHSPPSDVRWDGYSGIGTVIVKVLHRRNFSHVLKKIAFQEVLLRVLVLQKAMAFKNLWCFIYDITKNQPRPEEMQLSLNK